MKQKSLSVISKNHRLVLNYLKDKKIFKIFKEFRKLLKVKNKFAVAVSGGPDSLSLAYLAKCFSIKNNLDAKYYIVDHKLRKESSYEAKLVSTKLKKININCKILRWNGKKPLKNIQSKARNKRYSLLIDECKKNKINHLLLGHHINDFYENFFIRLLRGSGLKGLTSLSEVTKYNQTNIELLRPLIKLEKKDLIYLSQKVFNFYVNDPSNKDQNFKRIRVRNLLNTLEKEGFDKKKFLLTIDNLKDSNKSIDFYVEKNIKENSKFLKSKNAFILNNIFFEQSHEVVFRSLTQVIKNIGKKYYSARGKSVSQLIIKIRSNLFSKVTLGGCFIEKINESILIFKEN